MSYAIFVSKIAAADWKIVSGNGMCFKPFKDKILDVLEDKYPAIYEKIFSGYLGEIYFDDLDAPEYLLIYNMLVSHRNDEDILHPPYWEELIAAMEADERMAG